MPVHRRAAAVGLRRRPGSRARTARADAPSGGDHRSVIAPSRSVRSTRVPRAGVSRHHFGRRKMKLVAPPERDHRQRRRDRVDQLRARRRAAAVVRNLENVRRDGLPGVAASGQLALAVGLEIAREQQRAARRTRRSAPARRRSRSARPGRIRSRSPGALSNGPSGTTVAPPSAPRPTSGIGTPRCARERDAAAGTRGCGRRRRSTRSAPTSNRSRIRNRPFR